MIQTQSRSELKKSWRNPKRENVRGSPNRTQSREGHGRNYQKGLLWEERQREQRDCALGIFLHHQRENIQEGKKKEREGISGYEKVSRGVDPRGEQKTLPVLALSWGGTAIRQQLGKGRRGEKTRVTRLRMKSFGKKFKSTA